MKGTLLIDFDSTFIQTETLEVLAEVIQANNPDLLAQIEIITQDAMEGKLDFNQALAKRITLLKPTQTQIDTATEILKTQITPSFINNKAFIQAHAEKIYIVSGGFKSMIEPVVAEFGITPDHVFGNDFIFEDNIATSVNNDNLMAHTDGKARLVKSGIFTDPVFMIGDGTSDALTQKSNGNCTFIAFTENVKRENICAQSKHIVLSFDQAIDIVNN